MEYGYWPLESHYVYIYIFVFLLQVPVNCPVSGIVKHRKVQGNDCYEVSWKNIDGLDSSVVPADLLRRYGVL